MVNHFEHVRFHPVIGDRYKESNPLGIRLLILGESHYRWEGAPQLLADTTRVALGDGTYPFWKSLAAKVGTSDIDGGFWRSVAFYNYVQEFVGDGSRVRPTEGMWRSKQSIEGFKEVLEDCKPERILVIGKDTWRMMAGGEEDFRTGAPIIERRFPLPPDFSKGFSPEEGGYAFWYPTGGTTYALAAPIYHPGYPKGFHSVSTSDVVTQLLRKDWIAPSVSAN